MMLSASFVRAPTRSASPLCRLASSSSLSSSSQRRRGRPLPPSAAPNSSWSSSSSSSTIAHLAPSGAVFLREPSLWREVDDDLSDASSSSSGRGSRSVAAVDVVVVGVDHGDPDPSLGSFVLSCSPCSVVVETALCKRHGEATGNTVSLSGADGALAGATRGGPLGVWETSSGDVGPPAPSEEEPHVSQCLSLAERLSCLPDGSPEKAGLWSAMSSHFAGEQLAYVAALSTGARLVFGDVPKRETVLGLVGGRVDAAELDAAVAAQASSNALEALSGAEGAAAPPPPTDGGRFGRVYDVLVRERDAAICSVVAAEVKRELERRAERGERRIERGEGASGEKDDDAASSSSASTSASLSPSPSDPDPDSSREGPRPVVVVVGKWHVEGVRSLWESGEWRRVLEERRAGDEAPRPRRHPLLSASDDAGLRRALADELLRSTATADSAEEIDPEAFGGSLLKSSSGDGEGGTEEEERRARRAYDLTSELYGTSRMQLALLEREELSSVVSGWRCDFWEVVEPVRRVRASRGGPGFDEELLMSLRRLNFVLE